MAGVAVRYHVAVRNLTRSRSSTAQVSRPVYDSLSETCSAIEEFVADPQEILLGLPLQRHAGAYPGVAQEIPAHGQRQPERGEELAMLRRQRTRQRPGRRVVILADHQRADRHAVGMQRLQPAKAAPMGRDRGIAQKALEQGFVISLQRNEIRRKRIARQAIEDAARIGAAIDVIADRYGQTSARGTCFKIACDLADHAVEQIRSAVNIANDVEPLPLGQLRPLIHGCSVSGRRAGRNIDGLLRVRPGAASACRVERMAPVSCRR